MRPMKWWDVVDKSEWGPGPWHNEPDKEQWVDEATGLACLLNRAATTGALCGYVGVEKSHPWYDRDYDEINVDVHGGLTYGSFCMEGDPSSTICHVADPGDPDPLFWLGFDCAHAGDQCPGMDSRYRELGTAMPERFGEAYKTVAYVKRQCADLAAQVAQAHPVEAG